MANPVTDARVKKLWTMNRLAKEADVTPDTITRAERGERLLPLTQERIARALGVERTDLFPENEAVSA